MMNDVFGELEFDDIYIWWGETTINFMGKEENIQLSVMAEEDGEFEAGQYDAYKELISKWNDIQKDVLTSILDYYNEKRCELGYDVEDDEYYPEIKSTEELLEHITLVGIKVPYADAYGGRSIGIFFDCSWNEEDGVGIRLNNEEVVMVGYQDVAL